MMTREQAKQNQDRLAKHYNLAFWYGTNCEKCCGIYPKFMTTDGFETMCWYECEVCGKRTEKASMPWIAEEYWNKHQYIQDQIKMF